MQVSQMASKVVWYSYLFKNLPQFVVIHIVKGFNVVNEAEIDVFLEFFCFFYDPTDVVNWISGSFTFFKWSLYFWIWAGYSMIPAIPGTCGESDPLLFPHVCLPFFYTFIERSWLNSFLLTIFLWHGLLEPSRRNLNGLHEFQNSLLKPRGDIYFQSNLLVAPPEADE